MFIEAIKIRIITNSGKEYGRYINFLVDEKPREMNVIYGENTLGKSTLVKSIIYGLNGEAIYGKKSREIINYKSVMRRYFGEQVVKAQVFLQLNNKGKRIVVLRDAKDYLEPITVFNDVKLERYDIGKTLDEKASTKEYFKVRKENNIIGNRTYQEFLFSFLEIEPPREIDEDEQDGGLIFYIENLLPLNVIQQEAWTDIQAINPNYKIKDIKKIAFEFILKLSAADGAKYQHALERYNLILRQKDKSIKDISTILSFLNFSSVNEVNAEISKRNELIEEIQRILKRMEEGRNVPNNVSEELHNKYRSCNQIIKRHQDSIDLLEAEINQYRYYINKIELDIQKNDKLKIAKKLIGIIPIETCPRCLNDISINEEYELNSGNCSLCKSELQIVKRVEETTSYLKDERKDFQRLINDKEEAKAVIEGKLISAKLDIEELKLIMNSYEEQLKPENLETYHYYSRELGSLENSLKELERDKQFLKKYEMLKKEREGIHTHIKKLKREKRNISQGEILDADKLKFFQEAFKVILFNLDFLKNGFDKKKIDNLDEKIKGKPKKGKSVIDNIYEKIIIDPESYYPKIEKVNLYNITSSSGLIRIILAYYIALLKTCLEYSESTNHPLFLILDEPRQQNLDINTFNKFLEQFDLLKGEYPKKFQVILASSEKGKVKDEDIRLDLGSNEFLLREYTDEEIDIEE
ncbi:hypothetical protein bcgnr5378_13750 [Bacillus cereus]|uniref:hypothetical protein n=1 Tax=Bacillus TaxID=1386 RepID=UPI0007A8EF25|nr:MULTISPECIES: hypothetical protein [Bacillus]KYQ03158.1 hypothetical protein B4079_1638 [Bacillus cereus]MCT1379982.1 hypothetical protein [Bacillus sp. p3-SID196]MCU5470276.1 hypothetical protein [Bacillus paranthracis]MED1648398.1 hypothetical protein [Bacillus pacificus]